MADDTRVVARVRAGDRAMFEGLFREFYRPLVAFARRYVGSVAESEEIVQDVFLNLWRQRAGWVVAGTIRHYLFGAARNRGLDRARRERYRAAWRHRAEQGGEPILMSTAPVDAQAKLERDDFSAAVVRVVSAFPERQRETYLLRWAHHLTVPEIAATMGVTVKCVEAQLTKSVKTLRRELASFR